jgi:hypothetical protein
MLSDAERLGDVDLAIELEPKMADEAAFRKLCDARRKLACGVENASGQLWTGRTGRAWKFFTCSEPARAP